MSHIPLYVGYDPREAAAYTTFCQSVIERSSIPVAFHPLHSPMLANFNGQRDGTNAFIFSRYLIPYLQDFNGWAIFADGDMVLTEDIARLWALREQFVFNTAVAVVKHEYKTKHHRKYVGTAIENDNIDYPRKNWSSVMLWNCGHYANRLLTPEFVAESAPSTLHRFEWLRDDQIGTLPDAWNVLSLEQDIKNAKLIHYTLGIPGIPHYADCPGAEFWHGAFMRANHIVGSA